MVLIAVLSEVGVHCQRGGCASSSVMGSSGQSSSNGRTYDGSYADHVLPNCQEHVSLARVVVYGTMIWAVVGSRGCRVCARWPLLTIVLCRARFHEVGSERSAARQNALFELHALHASDQYDRMRGMCRGQSGEERALERMGEAMWRVDRKWKKVVLFFCFFSVPCAHSSRSPLVLTRWHISSHLLVL